jgi:glutamate/tyrosine decarboxylase-like PLP-dependent enzyme
MNLDNLDITRHLHELVRDHPDFEVLCEPTRDPYYFRYVPNTLVERKQEPEIQDQLDLLNEEIVESVQRNGFNLVITTRVSGRIAIQIANASNGTVDATFEAIARWARWLNNQRSVSNQTTPDMEAELCLSELDSSLTEVSAT